MKLLINVLGLAAASYLGYLLEPSLRLSLTGHAPSNVENGRNKKVILQMPGDVPEIDLASLTPDQLPAKVILKSEVKVTDVASGMNMLMPAGNRAKLVRIEGANAVVSPGEGPFYGLVPVTETDLFQQLAANPHRTRTPVEAPVAPTVAAPIVPGPSDSEESTKTPDSPTVSEPESEPTPESTPEATPDSSNDSAAPAAVGEEGVVQAMQASITAGQIKEFTFDQVLEWKADADETVEGEIYQVGLLSYKAETIFGTKTIQAKALLKGGKVLRWIWPKSGMEIK
jgi:hypothetical protein